MVMGPTINNKIYNFPKRNLILNQLQRVWINLSQQTFSYFNYLKVWKQDTFNQHFFQFNLNED